MHLLSIAESVAFMGTLVLQRPAYPNEHQAFALMAVPILTSSEKITLAQLIDNWAEPLNDPGHKQWLSVAPSVLVLQLVRYRFVQGRVIKDVTPIELAAHVDMPMAADRHRRQRYQLVSIILHHGDSPDRGHYTSICSAGAGLQRWLHLNDDHVPREVTSEGLLHLCYSDMYVLCLVRA